MPNIGSSTNLFLLFPAVYMCQYQVYSTSMAMLLTMVLSVYLFTFKPTLQVSCHALQRPLELLSISHGSEYFYMINDLFLVTLLQLFLGIIICMMSLHMYFAPPNKLVDLPSTTKAAPESLKEIYVERRTDS